MSILDGIISIINAVTGTGRPSAPEFPERTAWQDINRGTPYYWPDAGRASRRKQN